MKLRWHARPTAGSFQRAERLWADRTTPAEAARVVGEVRHAPVTAVPVSELAGGPLPPLDDSRVQRELERITAGKRLRPLVAVRRADRVHILDGHHRVTAVRHLDPAGTVRMVVANEGGTVNKKSMSRSERTAAKLAKAEETFAADLAAATIEVQTMDANDPGRTAARKRLAKLQGAYLQDHSAGFARAEELRKLDATGRAPETDGLAGRVDRLMKANPTIGYDELRGQLTREEQAAYLASVRGVA